MVQLWVNLPARDKMTSPRYQGIPEAKIPSIPLPGQSGSVRVIAGEYSGCLGPAQTFSPLNVWDIRVLAGRSAEFRVPEGYTTSLFVLKGGIRLPEAAVVGEAELAILETVGTNFEFEALEDSTLLLLNGKPLDEPIVGQGPFVMNTPSEVRQAFIDFQSGRMGHLE